MSVMDELEWNELVVVARHQGQVTVWKAWRRKLDSFLDPRMWEDTTAWPTYFTPLAPDTPWGPAGYGIVVMDLDRKVGWSINDYSHPSSLMLPNAGQARPDDHPDTAWRQLLATPSAWPHAKLRMKKKPDLVGANKQNLRESDLAVVPLSDILAGADALAPQDLVLHRGDFAWKDASWVVFKGTYLPEGWALHTTLGVTDMQRHVELLSDLRQAGFPPPDVAAWMDLAQSKLDHFDEGDEEVYLAQMTDLLSGWPGDKDAGPSRRPTL